MGDKNVARDTARAAGVPVTPGSDGIVESEAEALKVAFNDVDLCLRIRAAGYRIVWTPFARLIHHESKSRGAEDTPEKKARFEGEVLTMLDRWGPQLRADPYYNINLSRNSAHYRV